MFEGYVRRPSGLDVPREAAHLGLIDLPPIIRARAEQHFPQTDPDKISSLIDLDVATSGVILNAIASQMENPEEAIDNVFFNWAETFKLLEWDGAKRSKVFDNVLFFVVNLRLFPSIVYEARENRDTPVLHVDEIYEPFFYTQLLPLLVLNEFAPASIIAENEYIKGFFSHLPSQSREPTHYSRGRYV